MLKFNLKCSQKLDDGDTALVEDYVVYTSSEVNEIINQYAERAISKTYVDSFTVTVEIKR